MTYDLKIIGGTIVDGTGRPGYRGDIGIRAGKIVAVGEAKEAAEAIMDVDGRTVCPGFIDIHTHYDAQILWDRMLSISPWHGVTTAVMGNCGFGVAPTRPSDRTAIMRTLEKVEGMSFAALQAGLGTDWAFESFPEYLQTVKRRGTAINVAALVGHTPIRLYVMGDDAMEREATATEIEEMAGLVRDAVAAGAVGFSTAHAATQNAYDGRPIPSRLASFGEIDELVFAMKEAGGNIVQCSIGKNFFHHEMAELARRHNVPITWTALLSGMSGPGSHRKHLQITADQRAQGLNITPQVACRPVMFDFDFGDPFPFEMLPIFRELMKLDQDGRKAAYRDQGFREAFRTETAPTQKLLLAGWTERTAISMLANEPALEERLISEVANERGVDAIDLALDLAIESDFNARFRLPFLNYDQSELGELLTAQNAVLALSDAGAHASQLCDACYSTYFLGHWVRDMGLMEIEEAVHRLTQRPADLMGISDRGRLDVGMAADIVVFDPQTIGATGLSRVYDQPAGQDRLIADAIGIDAVLVNGIPIREHGETTVAANSVLPGKLLRPSGAA